MVGRADREMDYPIISIGKNKKMIFKMQLEKGARDYEHERDSVLHL